jgi:hypothetical protein
MRITILAVTLLALASSLEAQGRTYSVLYGRNISQGDLVKAIQDCDKKVLRPPCAELTRKASDMFPGAGKTSFDLGNYVSSLEGRKCPSNARVTTAAWVPAKELGQSQGRLAVVDQDSGCHATETLLWDKDENKPVISLYDGNLISNYRAPAETLQAGAQRDPAGVTSGSASDSAAKCDTPCTQRRTTTSDTRINTSKANQPALRPVPTRVDTVTRILQVTDTVNVTTHTVTEVRKGPRIWPWVLGAVALGGGIATYCHFEGCGSSNVNTNTNINGMAAMRRGIPLARF